MATCLKFDKNHPDRQVNFHVSCDFSKGKCQIVANQETTRILIVHHHRRPLQPTVMMQGMTDHVSCLQSALASFLPERLQSNVLFCLEVIITHYKNAAGLLEVIRAMFQLFQKKYIPLHRSNCHNYSSIFHFSCRLSTEEGISFNQRCTDEIRQIQPPGLVEPKKIYFLSATGPDSQFGLQHTHQAGAPFLWKHYHRGGAVPKFDIEKSSFRSVRWGTDEFVAFDKDKIDLQQ